MTIDSNKTVSEKEETKEIGMQFLKVLEKYTLESKMSIARKWSTRITGRDGIDIDSIKQANPKMLIPPSAIETFTLYSLVYDDSSSSECIDDKVFFTLIDKIQRHVPEEINRESLLGKAEKVVLYLGLQQFSTQGSFLIRLYRGFRFFTFCNDVVDMRAIFEEEYKAPFTEYAALTYCVVDLFSWDFENRYDGNVKSEYLRRILSKDHLINNISITKEDYLKRVYDSQGSLYEGDIGIRPQYEFPFIISDEKRYLPSPYLVVNAVTDSFLSRLTMKNLKLRNVFGKEVLEEYVYSIYGEIPSVTSIYREIEYGKKKEKKRSPDVIAFDSGGGLFFDTKAKCPSLLLRTLDEKAILAETKIYVKNIAQLYMRIKDYLAGEYSFPEACTEDSVFGVSVVLDDSLISRESVYQMAIDYLKNDSGKQVDEKFLRSRIKIIPLRVIEEYAIRQKSIVPGLINQLATPSAWSNYQFSEPFETDSFASSFTKFTESLVEEVGKLTST